MAKRKRHAAPKKRTTRRKYPKRPKKPKASATSKTWINFEEKMKRWEGKCREIDAAQKRKETIMKKYC